MSVNRRVLDASPDKVWAVLADGWLYTVWVVGAARMREVDDAWPAAGSKLHHSFGTWPVIVDDETEVLESEPPAFMKLRAKGWPAGEAEVDIRLVAQGTRTEVTIREDAISGPGVLIPSPARSAILHWRNDETLRRLAYVAERR